MSMSWPCEVDNKRDIAVPKGLGGKLDFTSHFVNYRIQVKENVVSFKLVLLYGHRENDKTSNHS